MTALLAFIRLVSVIVVAWVRIGVGVGVRVGVDLVSLAHRRRPIRIRRPNVHAEVSEQRMRLRQQRLGPRRAQKLERHARVAQHLSQSRVLRGQRGHVEVGAVIRVGPRAVHHPLHQRHRAIVGDAVEHRYEKRVLI
ncbi:hypothetical protein [Caballeronia sp. AZ1_KS37]|uniref:hypothetical protein n=1 Tax=Caballeronia sp. AZ1_KS37 TaxID=2921756 RepID=UPI00202860E3|nr:hypothetical protein [Caballeronia sp. AZ1_KS37]